MDKASKLLKVLAFGLLPYIAIVVLSGIVFSDPDDPPNNPDIPPNPPAEPSKCCVAGYERNTQPATTSSNCLAEDTNGDSIFDHCIDYVVDEEPPCSSSPTWLDTVFDAVCCDWITDNNETNPAPPCDLEWHLVQVSTYARGCSLSDQECFCDAFLVLPPPAALRYQLYCGAASNMCDGNPYRSTFCPNPTAR